MAEDLPKLHRHNTLPTDHSFRLIKLHPGSFTDEISCSLEVFDWSDSHPPSYEAVSYAWGNLTARAPLRCDDGILDVTQSLHTAIRHFRYVDRPRYLWADALCINQDNIPERSRQVSQMQTLYQNAATVLSFLGADEHGYAQEALEAVDRIAKFLCDELGISLNGQSKQSNIYQEIMLKNKHRLPVLDEKDFSAEVWKKLAWLFSHEYFSRVWPIQEVRANKSRLVYCGLSHTKWDHVDLVASYILAKPQFPESHRFTDTKCWWVATNAEISTQPKKWLHALYLGTNYSCHDPRDHIYALRGLIDAGTAKDLLEPDYHKTVIEVYIDSVQAAFHDQQRADGLLYVTGNESPSWVPRWDKPMLFRNPFRFGNPVPWQPSGDTRAEAQIDSESTSLSLSGFFVDSVAAAEIYNQRHFSEDSDRVEARQFLQKVLEMLEARSASPLSIEALNAAAVSLAFGQNEKNEIVEEKELLHKFVAFIRVTLGERVFNKYISPQLSDETKDVPGDVFGKPVWDFEYPASSFFITTDGLIGCSTSVAQPGDKVFVALGSSYPFLLRPVADDHLLKGFVYVHGVMRGEKKDSPTTIAYIR